MTKQITSEFISDFRWRQIESCACFQFLALVETSIKSFNAFIFRPIVLLPLGTSANTTSQIIDFRRVDVSRNDRLDGSFDRSRLAFLDHYGHLAWNPETSPVPQGETVGHLNIIVTI